MPTPLVPKLTDHMVTPLPETPARRLDMDKALETVISKIADTWEDCAQMLGQTDDPEQFDTRINKLATTFVGAALYLRDRYQGEEVAVNDLMTDTFVEIVRLTKPAELSEIEGEVFVHAPASIRPEGVRPCQDWLIRY